MSAENRLIIPAANITINPDDLQRRAADPGQSVWVAASAGSGKTKVLTDRVLRLLLPRSADQPGTPASKILCLTFTKAGAAEMAVRINREMAKWAVADEAALYDSLTSLLGRAPEDFEAEAARRLFAQVIDSPGGLKILTIHSFCQSVLGRFPVEAGLPPHFKAADDRATMPLQQDALENVLRDAAANPDGPVAAAIALLSQEKGEGELTTLLQGVMAERTQLFFMLRRYDHDFAKIESALCDVLEVRPSETVDSAIETALENGAYDEAALRSVIKIMAGSTSKKMQARGPVMQAMLDSPASKRPALYHDYMKCFLTNEGAPYQKDLVTNDIRSALPDAEGIMLEEAERLAAVEHYIKAVRCMHLTSALLRVGVDMLKHYAAEKARHALLDYDDLIATTLDLLSGRSMGASPQQAAAWVRYKLDQGIDHILVDEAQDTNPEQWDIIHALCDEFFDGTGARGDTDRSIFAVGDEKQSIFGFQRAAPEKFRAAETYYKNRAIAAGRKFESVDMFVSFRSTAPVLAVTDAVFNSQDPAMMLGLPDGANVQHISHRSGQAGRVEIWPMITTTPPPEPEPWAPPVTLERSENAETILAQTIAGQIKGWIDSGEVLPAYGRAVRAGDIMILVRSRGTMVDHLVRALKTAKVPVSGVDRMVLSTQIAVQDMMVAAQFALQPEDDLSLAALLKSPLIGLNEDQLYDAAIDRDGQSLWSAAKGRLRPAQIEWLSDLIVRGGVVHPYEFFSHLLHHPCPADPKGSGLRAMLGRLGEDAGDPLQEFLNSTLQFEQDNIPSLQQFIHWQAQGNTEIKRELEAAGEKVRIMTVHASKGLQAPIVILPDTAHGSASITKIGTADRVLWTQHGGMPLPLWSPRKDIDPAPYKAALDERKLKLAEEYRRLFYVAMTRAADRLYIAGCSKAVRNQPADDCWYNLALGAMGDMGAESFVAGSGDGALGFRIDTAQTATPDRIARGRSQDSIIVSACADWSWLDRDPPAEATPPRPWTPSRPSDPEPAMRSPLDAMDDQYRFARGNATHTLLQFLPALPQAQWDRAATTWLGRQPDLSMSVRADIWRETKAILTNAAFAALFGPGSMAEVPITGLIHGKLVSGQIDRLVITPDEVHIIDYKTNRPPPTDPNDIPAVYRTQLQAYRDTLATIYPGRTIRASLLWTDGPFVMEIGT